MLLSDGTIRELIESGEIGLELADPERQIQPASVDLRLDNKFITLDPRDPGLSRLVKVVDTRPGGNQPRQITRTLGENECWMLRPGECVLAQTVERLRIGAGLAARVEGRSSWARLFIQIHCTAGWIDPGFNGNITLEITNIGPLTVKMFPGQYVTQVSFYRTDKPCVRPYAGKYQGQTEPTASRLHIKG